MEGLLGLLLSLGAAFVVLAIYILIPAGMAKRRGRSAIIWVLVSLMFTPIVAMMLLLLLGNALGWSPEKEVN